MGILLALFFASTPALAWDKHQELLDRILLGPAAETRAYLQRRVPVPCADDERKELDELSARIRIRADAVGPLAKHRCGPKAAGKTVTLELLLGEGFIDEPDLGMDQDLPESDDPEHFRKWMGGATGPTSQGFRHMVFPGIEWSSPLATFQIPFSRVGEALKRLEVLKKASDDYFAAGNLFFGIRTFLWREHLIQDLFQPFHSTQIPSLKLLPWKRMLGSPVKASSQAIANYHYAFEGVVREMIKTPWERGIQECLEGKEAAPLEGGDAALRFPRSKAGEVGDLIYGVFGDYLKRPDVDLPEGIGQVDYYALVNSKGDGFTREEKAMLSQREQDQSMRSERISGAMDGLRTVSCELMKELTRVFWGDLDQAISKVPSNNTGK